jgi:replicative DNA helicase
MNKPRVHPAVYLASSSERLATDVQDLLLRLGITAVHRRVSQGTKGRMQHHVWVTGGSDLEVFVNRVGAVGEYKSRDLERVGEYLRGRVRNTDRDVIPREVWGSIVRPAMVATHVTQRQLHERLGIAYAGATIFGQRLGRERAERVAAAVASEPLQKLARSDIYWDTIADIEADGVEEVFDLTVPGNHNFVANGVVVHNSIEQDADLVMFLFRPEYYAAAEKRDELEGKSELIISKQRNGPTGVIELVFQKAYTRFDSALRNPGQGGGPRPRDEGGGYLP